MKTPRQSQRSIAPDIILERNVPVVMPDGVRLFANVFRPATSGRYPAILSVTPYSCVSIYKVVTPLGIRALDINKLLTMVGIAFIAAPLTIHGL